MFEFFGAIQRAALQAGVLLLVGTAAWRLWISRQAFGQAMGDVGAGQWRGIAPQLTHRVARIASFVAVALIPIWLLRFYLQVVGFRDPFAPLSEDITILLRYTIFGPVWIGQGVTILIMAGVLLRLRHAPENEVTGRSTEWGIVVLGAVVLSFTLAMSSHGLSVEGSPVLAVAADMLHTVAAGAWLGSLVLILSTRKARGVGDDAHFGAQLRAFSPIAVAAVTVLVAMGVYLGWQYVGTLGNLWGTIYGRILLAKVAVVGVVLLMGLLNWRTGMPDIDSPNAREVVWRRARWEVIVAVVVLLLTGALTGAPRPPEATTEELGRESADPAPNFASVTPSIASV